MESLRPLIALSLGVWTGVGFMLAFVLGKYIFTGGPG